MLGGLQQGCTLLLLGTLSREPCLWQAARLDSALTVPARQWLLEGAHGQRARKGAWNCQGFQTAVCCNPNSVKLQKICIRWIMTFLVIWTGNPYCLLDTEKPRWILGDSLFFLTPAEAAYAWKTALELAEVSRVGMFRKDASKEYGVTHPWKHTDSLPRDKNFVLSAW